MIDYNLTTNKNVLQNLTTLINGEFRTAAIRYDDKYSGTSYFKLTPVEDNVVELRTKGVLREYSVTIQYFEKQIGRYTKTKSLDNRINIIERLKEILRQNTASIDEFVYLVDANGADFLTSDSDNFVIVKRPYLITSQDDYFITADTLAFTTFPVQHTYEWHQAQLDSVVYDAVSDRSNYLAATADFKCLVEEVYA